MKHLQEYFWDLILPVYKLEGIDNKRFLNGQTTSNILDIENNQTLRSCWLSPTGRVQAILEVKLIEDNLYFIVIGGDNEKLIEGFEKVIFPSDNVEIKLIKNIRRVQKMSFKHSWKETSSNWIDLNESLPSDYEDSCSANKELTDEWIIRQGIPIGSEETNGRYNPFELGISDLVSLEKGCYLGQETLSKLSIKGILKEELRFFQSKEIVKKGDKLYAFFNNFRENIGVVTSAIIDHDSGTIGLAVIRKKFLHYKEIKDSEERHLISLSLPIGFNGL